MSIEHLKKQAKNALHLLPEFLATHQPPYKLADCQQFVAQTHGYPDWHAAQQQNADGESKAKLPRPPDLWMLRYDEFATGQERLLRSEIRLLAGVVDAFGVFWHTFSNYSDSRDEVVLPDRFKLTLQPCAEASTLANQCLQLDYQLQDRRLCLRLYPVAPEVAMIDGPMITSAAADMLAYAQKARRPDDMASVLAMNKRVFDAMHEECRAYHDEHPGKAVFAGLDEFLRQQQRELPPPAPGEGLYTLEEVRLGRWRISLLIVPRGGRYTFDVFDEGGRTASKTCDLASARIEETRKGWVVHGSGAAGAKPLALTDLPTDADATRHLRELAIHLGLPLQLLGADGVPANPRAPAIVRFEEWLAKKEPEVFTIYQEARAAQAARTARTPSRPA